MQKSRNIKQYTFDKLRALAFSKPNFVKSLITYANDQQDLAILGQVMKGGKILPMGLMKKLSKEELEKYDKRKNPVVPRDMVGPERAPQASATPAAAPPTQSVETPKMVFPLSDEDIESFSPSIKSLAVRLKNDWDGLTEDKKQARLQTITQKLEAEDDEEMRNKG